MAQGQGQCGLAKTTRALQRRGQGSGLAPVLLKQSLLDPGQQGRACVAEELAAEGEVLDKEGQLPQSYAAERAPTAFERELWARFWELANDPEEAKKRGVRALHGEAVSTRLRKDRVYSITLRSTGELAIQPIK